MKWFVIYTRSRWEKKVTEGLEELGIEAYCPTVIETRQWSDRKKKVSTPLFKSYVFVHISESRRHDVFQVMGVVNFLFWLGKPAVVRNEEIVTIKNWLNKENVEEIKVDHLSAGDKLVIANGNFKGHEAMISKVGKKRMRLILKSLDCVINVKTSQVLE